MAKLRIRGDTSGYVDIAAPDVAGAATVNLDKIPQTDQTVSFAGNVGIGTASPSTPLDVTKAGGSNYVATFQNTTSATPYGVWIKDAPSAANAYPLLTVGNSAGSQTYFRVDSGTGYVTTPKQPAFYARRTSGYTSSGVIPFDDISVNVGSHFNGSRFTAPITGLYYATGSWLPNSNSAGSGWIQKNGTRVSANAYNLAADNHATATVIVSLAFGDYLEFAVNVDGTEATYCHFGAYLIG